MIDPNDNINLLKGIINIDPEQNVIPQNIVFPKNNPSEECVFYVHTILETHVLPSDFLLNFLAIPDLVYFRNMVIDSGETVSLVNANEFLQNIVSFYPTGIYKVDEILTEIIIYFYSSFSECISLKKQLHSVALTNSTCIAILYHMALVENIDFKRNLWKNCFKLNGDVFIQLVVRLLHEPICPPPKRFKTISRLTSLKHSSVFRIYQKLGVEGEEEEFTLVLDQIRSCIRSENIITDDIRYNNPKLHENSDFSPLIPEKTRIEMSVEALGYLQTLDPACIPDDIIELIAEMIDNSCLKEKIAAIDFFNNWPGSLPPVNCEIVWELLATTENSVLILSFLIKVANLFGIPEPEPGIIDILNELASSEDENISILAIKMLEIGQIR